MQKVTVMLECDEHGDEGTETVSFSYDGRNYEIDLCDRAAKQLRKVMTPFIEHGHRVVRHRRPVVRQGGRTLSDREHSKEVRAVLMASGYPVAERGRLPEAALEQYEALQEAADDIADMVPAPRPSRRNSRKPTAADVKLTHDGKATMRATSRRRSPRRTADA
jgi:Lsr2